MTSITFNRTVNRAPCGYLPKSRRFLPLPMTVTSEPVTQEFKMRTMPDGSRRLVTRRDHKGRAV